MAEIRKCNSGCEHYHKLGQHTAQCSYKFDLLVKTDMSCRFNLPLKGSSLDKRVQSFGASSDSDFDAD